MNKPGLDPHVDMLLQESFGLSFSEIHSLVEDKKQNDYLNQYRGALSLWAEEAQDIKSKIIVTLDGRDTAGKGSNIKRVTEYLDVKIYEERAFGIPSDEEKFRFNWFDRYKQYFPESGKITFFDRSWYNRAGVEAAMGFCTEEEYNWFMSHVNQFEKDHIVDMGFEFLKIYLSVTKHTQKKRLKNRDSEMKRWKSSMIDKKAQEKWNYYTLAKYKMLELTNSEHAPWLIIDSNEKFLSAVEIMKAIINTSSEVSQIVTSSLSVDLSPNPEIVRTAGEEIKRMQSSEEHQNMKLGFNFKEL